MLSYPHTLTTPHPTPLCQVLAFCHIKFSMALPHSTPIPIPSLEFSVTGHLYPREQNPELSQPYIVPYHDDGFDS